MIKTEMFTTGDNMKTMKIIDHKGFIHYINGTKEEFITMSECFRNLAEMAIFDFMTVNMQKEDSDKVTE